MRILGVDTTTNTASVALVEDSHLLAEAGQLSERETGALIRAKGNHSETVLPLIQGVLDQAQVRLADLSAIAISIGPGSFTGLRIGLALVKGIAYQSDLPVIGVSSLEAQAARVNEPDAVICPLIDARKQEVYAALFDRSAGTLLRRMSDQVFDVAALAMVAELMAEVSPIHFVGNGGARYGAELTQMFGARARVIGDGCDYSVGHALARLAQERFSAASGANVGPLVPFYLGSSQGLGNARVIPPNSLK